MTRLSLFLALSLFATSASAAVRLCSAIAAPKEELASFEKLVRSELARHPTYQSSAEHCDLTLSVELFRLGQQLYLTARTGKQVPVREMIASDAELADKLSKVITLVLENDPVELARDPGKLSSLQRAARSVLAQGHTELAVELIQVVSVGAGSAGAASGAAFALSRGSVSWYPFVRIYAAGSTFGAAAGRRLRLASGGDIGLRYEFRAREFVSPYLAAGLGVQINVYEGPVGSHAVLETAITQLTNLSLRCGVKAFRFSDFGLDFFAAGYLPLYRSSDSDAPEVINHYTPSLQLGVAITF